ncbi:MAG: hypothetical protein NC247_04920 [Ruminococcus flavefaciens]|nr:hypothetical protein [Ruminococcus flavefaciens]MCM1361044.1 hypothetical protein [Clostridiales bacterium]
MVNTFDRWIFYKERNVTPIDDYDYDCGYICSNCGFELPSGWYDDADGYPDIKFCPNCDANMSTVKSTTINFKSSNLCRGKQISMDKWVTGYYVEYQPSANSDIKVVGIVPTYASNLYLIPIRSETVGKYICVIISNTPIFVGDLLKDNHSIDGRIYEVVQDGYRFKLSGFYDSSYDNPDDAFSENLDRFELVGNIYDNPELVSVQ